MKSVRMEVRVKNNRLWRLIHENFRTEAEAASAMGVGVHNLNAAVNLRGIPYSTRYHKDINRRFGEILPWAKKICDYFEKSPEWVFPPEIYTNNKWELKIIEADRADFIGLPSSEKILQIGGESETEAAARNSLSVVAVEKVLSSLPTRESEIIRHRFGLDGVHCKSLREVGKIFKIGCERVRQIEAKAIWLMRHPSRSKFLSAYS